MSRLDVVDGGLWAFQHVRMCEIAIARLAVLTDKKAKRLINIEK
jgi:hypothetical protein